MRLGHGTLDDRRAAVIASIEEQGKLTPQLREALIAAETKARVEDIYLPYKVKRRTKAQIAREAGLEPLADRLLAERDGKRIRVAGVVTHRQRPATASGVVYCSSWRTMSRPVRAVAPQWMRVRASPSRCSPPRSALPGSRSPR